MPRYPEDLTHHRFGLLTVVKPSPTRKAHWVCLCDCGAVRVIRADSLQRGRSLSCGCYRSQIVRDRKELSKQRKLKRRMKPRKPRKPPSTDWI